MDKMIKDFKSKLPNCTQGMMVLYFIISLSEKLVSSVRYPNLNDMINPSVIYNLDNPLVEALPIFQNALHFCRETIKEIEY